MSGNLFNLGRITRKVAKTMTRVIDEDAAYELAIQTGLLHTIHKGDLYYPEYMFVDNHGVPDTLVRHEWIPCTTEFPFYVVKREGIENGLIDTIEKWKLVHGRNSVYVYNTAREVGRVSLREFIEFHVKFIANGLKVDTLGHEFIKCFKLPYSHRLKEMNDKDAYLYILTNYVSDVGVKMHQFSTVNENGSVDMDEFISILRKELA